jgi:hypothetical protein
MPLQYIPIWEYVKPTFASQDSARLGQGNGRRVGTGNLELPGSRTQSDPKSVNTALAGAIISSDL